MDEDVSGGQESWLAIGIGEFDGAGGEPTPSASTPRREDDWSTPHVAVFAPIVNPRQTADCLPFFVDDIDLPRGH